MITADTNYVSVKQDLVPSWIPAEAYVGSLPDHKMFEGKMVYQDVIFANRTGRHPARVTRVSDKHDVAMLKVDVGTKLKTVELFDNYQDVQSGEEVSVLGYPGLTPNGERYEAGNGPSTSSKVRVVPNLAINQGIISALHKAVRGSSPERVRAFADTLGDLGINATVRRTRGTDIDAACGQLRATQVEAPTRRVI